MPWLSDNPLWEEFGQRALLHTAYGGADFGECLATVRATGDTGGPTDWHREWTATAERVASIACQCADRGHNVSAHEAFLRASTYHRVAYFPLFGAPVDPRLVASFNKDVECFRRAAALAPYPLEPIEIPWGCGSMPGYFARPDHSDVPRPTLVQTNGYDSNVHEMFFSNAVAARAAAFEHRIAALIADPGQWDMRDTLVASLPLSDAQKAAFPDIDPHALDPMEQWLREKADPMTRWKFLQRGIWVHAVDSLFDYFVALLDYEVSPVVDQITCPTLVTMAEGDPVAIGATKLYDALRVPKALVRFTTAEGAGGHCETMARSLYHQRTFDWLADVLS